MPDSEVALALALALECLLGKVFGGFGGFWRVLEGFGRFAGWQTTALTANRNHCCGLPDSEVALALGCLLGRCLEGLEGFGGFGGFWRFCRVWSVCGLANGSFESQ